MGGVGVWSLLLLWLARTNAVCTGVCLPSSLSGQAREERNGGANEKAAITLNAEMKHESAEHALKSWTRPDFFCKYFGIYQERERRDMQVLSS